MPIFEQVVVFKIPLRSHFEAFVQFLKEAYLSNTWMLVKASVDGSAWRREDHVLPAIESFESTGRRQGTEDIQIGKAIMRPLVCLKDIHPVPT